MDTARPQPGQYARVIQVTARQPPWITNRDERYSHLIRDT
jgi:hypothetical protein